MNTEERKGKGQEEKGEHQIDLCAGSTQGSLGGFPSPRFSVPGLYTHLPPYNLEGEKEPGRGPGHREGCAEGTEWSDGHGGALRSA